MAAKVNTRQKTIADFKSAQEELADNPTQITDTAKQYERIINKFSAFSI